MANALGAILTNPENQVLLAAFGVFIVVAFVFALLYHAAYKDDEDNFYFPRDEVYRARHDSQRYLLKQQVSETSALLEAMQDLISELKHRPAEMQAQLNAGEVILTSGRRFSLVRHEHPPQAPGQPSEIDTRLGVHSHSGFEILSMWFYEDLPRDVTGFGWAVSVRTDQLGEQLGELRKQLATVATGKVIWRYSDFVYFSALTQVTLGCNEIVASSHRVRRTILWQMLWAYSILVVAVNAVLGASR